METSAQRLVRDEIFDLALYRRFRTFAKGDLAAMLDEFIATEIRHVAFWRAYFRHDDVAMGVGRQMKLALLSGIARIGGASAMTLILEAIEVHGVKKYLTLWQSSHDSKFRDALLKILQEELQHEDEALASSERRITAGTVRNIFLGFNDGSVEILGAVNGLAAAFGDPSYVAAAGLTVAVAGALSMATGAYLSTDSENEILETEAEKAAFLSDVAIAMPTNVSPRRSALLVGVSYLLGAAVPIAPFLLGAHSPWWSIGFSSTLILAVASALAFLSGMRMTRRMLLNGLMLAATVLVAYGMGELVDRALLQG